MRLLVLVVLALLLILLLPTWPYTEPWGLGYWPSGLIGLFVIVFLVMAAISARAGPP
jgi:hypothetical protein